MLKVFYMLYLIMNLAISFFISFYLNDFPSYFHIYPLHAKAITKVVDSTSIPSHYSRSLDYDHCIMTFVDVEVKEYIEERKEKEKIMLVYDTGMNLSPLSKCLTRRAILFLVPFV
jgi:hypothetical protein